MVAATAPIIDVDPSYEIAIGAVCGSYYVDVRAINVRDADFPSSTCDFVLHADLFNLLCRFPRLTEYLARLTEIFILGMSLHSLLDRIFRKGLEKFIQT